MRRTKLRLACPMCFSYTKALVDPFGGEKPVSGAVVFCACGALNIYDAKRRPAVLRRPTVAELLLIEGNSNVQRLLALRAERRLH